ncbi:Z-ring formation inhibitor MciZ [Ammoniphilus sp. YIM 78166]|uniref:Z-ring formation inhibitor MciZ n=1 Tax=Ammoniphilus sp. YIM 78166 TaxID=1644106 RepID=UPI001F0D1F2D|nr:Z-ring formation inhibitor MciZ [Ammoniphilus sp. YIM 78166]
MLIKTPKGGTALKIYFHSNTIRVVGKVWEIRAKLKEWSNLSMTVQDLLSRKGH